MSELKTSAQASEIVGTASRNSLTVFIKRHPDLKPKVQLPSGDYLWTLEEIERVKARKGAIRPGRKPKAA